MKKTQRKDAFRNIRKRIVSYLSICLVTMLGLGGVFITSYMGAGINAEATRYYNEHGFKNYELLSSMGVADEDVEQIRNTEGVSDAEGVIRTKGSFTKGDLNCNVELISMTERISVPEVTEGSAAEAKDECMVGEDFALTKGLKVGDRVKLVIAEIEKPMEPGAEEESAKPEKEGALLGKEFTITGFVKHPDYFRRKSTDIVVLPWAAFNTEYLGDFRYSHVFVKTDDPEGEDIFSGKYFEKTADTKLALEDLAKTLEIDTAARTKKALNEKVDKQWQEALDELEKGQNEIDENEATMNAELARARQDLEDAQNELDLKISEGNKKLKAGEEEIKAGEKTIKDSEEKIRAGENTIKKGEKKVKAGEKKIRDGAAKIKDAKEKLSLIEKNLPAAKKLLKELKEKYEGDLDSALRSLTEAKAFLDKLKKFDSGSEEYKKLVKSLANLILEKEDTIYKVQGFFSKDEVMTAAEKIRDVTEIDATGHVAAIKNFDVDGLIRLAEGVIDNGENMHEFVRKTQEFIDDIQNILDDLDKYEKYIEKFEKNKGDYYKLIADKEKELAAGKRELAAAKRELAAAKRELAAAKEKLAAGKEKLAAAKAELAAGKKKLADEKSKYQAKIRDGWNMYYTQKADLELKLEEAKALLAENREEAEAKIAQIRADIDSLECKWLVLDRRANAGYVDARSNIGAISSASLIFGILFMLISAIVCFSTLSIIIEEQKKMVGTVKAFGFHKGEILGKYLIFGVSASVVGSIAGILLALGLSGAVLRAYYNSGMYQFDPPKSVVTPETTAIACAVMIAICAAASVIACLDILRSPASILMKGGTAKKKTGQKKKKTAAKRGGSLYSRLIIRNMLDDKVRVAISIIIIAFSTMLVGTGISMKLAFDGMTVRQVSDVYKYDVRVDLGKDIEAEDRGAVEKVLNGAGTDYTTASYTTHVFRLGDRLDAVNVLAGEPDDLGKYFAVRDAASGRDLELPEDGVLAQKKMKESYDMGEGSTLSIFSEELDECSTEVKGVFQNYVGRLVITSPAGYKHIFGADAPANCYLVKLNGADLAGLENDLLAVNDDISFEVAEEFAKKFETASLLYNLIVMITTGIAILMSFMILSNLANIFLNRKKTELTVMRINGFSIKQTKGYLTRETVVTTAAGVVLGVIAGAIGTPFIIRTMEQPDLQFIRTFHAGAWAAAVALEVLFAVVIYSAVFRKVKDLNFRDVA